jgi:hypothetical protein
MKPRLAVGDRVEFTGPTHACVENGTFGVVVELSENGATCHVHWESVKPKAEHLQENMPMYISALTKCPEWRKLPLTVEKRKLRL